MMQRIDKGEEIVNVNRRGIGAGAAIYAASEIAGLRPYLHEAGHAAAASALLKSPHPDIQVDAFHNIADFFDNPSSSSLGRVLTGYDVHQDGAKAYVKLDWKGGPTDIGEKIGSYATPDTMINVSGSLATEIPAIAAFTAGFRMRRNHPLAGYTLMGLGAIHHVSNSIYPASAAFATGPVPGHDWLNFARSTGIPASLTAAVFAVSLPAVAAALYLLEKRQEEKQRERQAVDMLVWTAEIGEGELQFAFGEYSRRDRFLQAESAFEKALEKAPPGGSGEFDRALKRLEGEYGRFSDFLAARFRPLVEDKKKELPASGAGIGEELENLAAGAGSAWKDDKVGTGLKALGIAGACGIAVRSALNAIEAIAPGAFSPAMLNGTILRSLVPGVGLVATAERTHHAIRTMRRPGASKREKAAAAAVALFTAISAAGTMIPGAQPLALVGLGGIAATYLAGKYADRHRA